MRRSKDSVGGHRGAGLVKQPRKRAKLPGRHPAAAIYLSCRQKNLNLFILRTVPEGPKAFVIQLLKIFYMCVNVHMCVQFSLMTEGFSDSSRNKSE